VYDANGDQEVGKISKQWSGFVQEYFTDADNFGVNCNYLLLRLSRSLAFTHTHTQSLNGPKCMKS